MDGHLDDKLTEKSKYNFKTIFKSYVIRYMYMYIIKIVYCICKYCDNLYLPSLLPSSEQKADITKSVFNLTVCSLSMIHLPSIV